MILKKHVNRKGAKNAKETGDAGVGGFVAQRAKTMFFWNFPGHQMDFMSLFPLRLRVFAVNELRFPG
ncbi:MAG: hypothetical protein LLG15_03385 [Betaproteobacteria bacterium]|nr:hypothetical protein [Betaproteobacteria bacterium]